MRLYLECGMGAAGDMLTAALYELLDEKDAFLRRLNSAGLTGVTVAAEQSVKCGVSGTHMRVEINGAEEEAPEPHSHSHHSPDGHTHSHKTARRHAYSLSEIKKILSSLNLPEEVRADAAAVYTLLAAAEAEVHGGSTETVHFHEVGAMDAIADITGVCLAVHMLGIRDIHASPVHTGSGYVRCEHGEIPVPAPAAARLLEGVPVYGGEIRGELCTPTGAALLRHFVKNFGAMEPAVIRRTGYGMGKKDFPRLNAVRSFLLDTEISGGGYDEVVELCCNLDDMTAEEIGFASEELLKNGALDVFTAPVYMKKNRPGTLLTVLCRPADEDKFTRLIFRHTATLGIRVTKTRRAVLNRSETRRQSAFGEVRAKISEGFGVSREKMEYDDIAAITRDLQ